MKRLISTLSLVVMLHIMPATAGVGIAVIVNPQSSMSDLSRKQIADIFMGRSYTLANHNRALTPLDLGVDSPVREQFYQSLTGKNLAQIDAYWARLHFTGQSTAPKNLNNAKAVLQSVQANRFAIGYIPADEVDPSVKVLLIIE